MRHAGAARFAFNHHLARVKANLDQRSAEASYGIPAGQQTPALSWSKVSFINEFNAWKTGRTADSPANDDGSRGLAWRAEVSQDVFECASAERRAGAGQLLPFGRRRPEGQKGRLPEVQVPQEEHSGVQAALQEPSPAKRRRCGSPDRKHCGFPTSACCGYTAARNGSGGCSRPVGCTCTEPASGSSGDAGGCPCRASPPCSTRRDGRPPAVMNSPAGMDVGVKSLAVVADTAGVVLHQIKGVEALQHAQHRLRRANQAQARTKPGSHGRRKARERLTKLHGRIASLRAQTAHEMLENARDQPDPVVPSKISTSPACCATTRLRKRCPTPGSATSAGCWPTRPAGTAVRWSRPTGGTRRRRGAPAAVNSTTSSPSASGLPLHRLRARPRPGRQRGDQPRPLARHMFLRTTASRLTRAPRVCTRLKRERADRHPAPPEPPGLWIGTGASRTATNHQKWSREAGVSRIGTRSVKAVPGSQAPRVGDELAEPALAHPLEAHHDQREAAVAGRGEEQLRLPE